MISILVVAGALLGALQAAPATATAADDTLAALVEEALARNPDLRAAEEAVNAARERPAQTSALADPALGVTYTNEGWSPSLGGMPDSILAVMVSQDLPYPGKRRLRGEISALAADEATVLVLHGVLGASPTTSSFSTEPRPGSTMAGRSSTAANRPRAAGTITLGIRPSPGSCSCALRHSLPQFLHQ